MYNNPHIDKQFALNEAIVFIASLKRREERKYLPTRFFNLSVIILQHLNIIAKTIRRGNLFASFAEVEEKLNVRSYFDQRRI